MSFLLGATGRVWKRSVSVTEGGGTESGWSPGGNLECRLAPVGGGLGEGTADEISDRTTHIATLPAWTEIEEGDQLEIGGAGLYEVTAVRKRTFDELVRRVELVESAETIPGLGSAS